MWRIWCYALGKKEGRDKKDADKIAIIRTLIMIQLLITNCFIIAGNIRHWNDNNDSVQRRRDLSSHPSLQLLSGENRQRLHVCEVSTTEREA